MAVPFGLSIGDFVSGIKLMRDTIKALDDTRGARSNFLQLCSTLESLEAALGLADQLDLSDDQIAYEQALDDAFERCRQCVDSFVEKIFKFEVLDMRRTSRWSAKRFATGLKKLQWSLLKKDDVSQFRTDVSSHVEAIQMILISFQVAGNDARETRVSSLVTAESKSLREGLEKATKQHLQRLHEVRGDIRLQQATLDAVYAQVSTTSCMIADQSALISAVTGNLDRTISPDQQRFAVELLPQILNHVAEIKSQQLAMIAKTIPPQVLLLDPVILHDPLGRSAPFNLDFITSAEAFLAVLKIRFRDCGATKIENEEFALEDTMSNRDININLPWSRVFKPGQQVDMSMIFKRQRLPPHSCPNCNRSNGGDCDEFYIKCAFCSLTYRKVDTILPRHRRVEPSFFPSAFGFEASSTERRSATNDVDDIDDLSFFTRIRILNQVFLHNITQPPFQPSRLADVPGDGNLNGISPSKQAAIANGEFKKSGLVEFDDALNYVDKIKNRFSAQPDIYRQFLEILQAYQRESKSVLDIYDEFTRLFRYAPDLLEDLKQFLPKAVTQSKAHHVLIRVSKDPSNPSNLVYEPALDSDELFYALRQSYPNIQSHRERVKQAAIDFREPEPSLDSLANSTDYGAELEKTLQDIGDGVTHMPSQVVGIR